VFRVITVFVFLLCFLVREHFTGEVQRLVLAYTHGDSVVSIPEVTRLVKYTGDIIAKHRRYHIIVVR
jgi:hypothetical protein